MLSRPRISGWSGHTRVCQAVCAVLEGARTIANNQGHSEMMSRPGGIRTQRGVYSNLDASLFEILGSDRQKSLHVSEGLNRFWFQAMRWFGTVIVAPKPVRATPCTCSTLLLLQLLYVSYHSCIVSTGRFTSDVPSPIRTSVYILLVPRSTKDRSSSTEDARTVCLEYAYHRQFSQRLPSCGVVVGDPVL